MRLSGGVEIRTAVAEDAPGLATVHVRGWQLAYRGLMADEFLDGLSVEERERWHSSRLSRLGRGEAVLVGGGPLPHLVSPATDRHRGGVGAVGGGRANAGRLSVGFLFVGGEGEPPGD